MVKENRQRLLQIQPGIYAPIFSDVPRPDSPNCADTVCAIGRSPNSPDNIWAIDYKAYRLYLPSKEELRRKLVEWAEEQEAKREGFIHNA